ncbi:MAG: oligosaccharide flippase family protein [Bacillota bacterium]
MEWSKAFQRRPVLTNVAILTGSAFLERLLGGVYRIVLARAAGPEALGLLQYCLPFLRLGLIITTLGLPPALTRGVAAALARGRKDEAEAMTVWSLRAVGVSSLVLAGVFLVSVPLWRRLFPDPRVVSLFGRLVPVLVAAALGLVLQGWFQGQNRMWPLAFAGLLGQLGKLGLGLFFIARASRRGPVAMAAAALTAMAVSESAACVFLFFLARLGNRRFERPGRLLQVALPLMGDGLVFALANAADMAIIPARLLAAGVKQAEITPLLGRAWGMALPTVFLPMVFVWPITAANLPVISAATAKRDLRGLRRRIGRVYLTVAGISLAAAAAFGLLARPIVAILYSAPEAAPFLAAFAWAAPPIYLAGLGGDLLVALGRTRSLFRQSVFSVIVRTGLIYLFTGRPGLGIFGAVFGLAFGNGLLAVTCARTVKKALYELRNEGGPW